MELNLKSLINKMNSCTRSALESSAGYCMNRGHYNVEIEHFIYKLLDEKAADLQNVLSQLSVNPDILMTEINSSLDKLQSGNVKPPALSLELINLVKQAWVISSVEFEHSEISSAHIFGALLLDDKLRNQFISTVPSISKISIASTKQAISDTYGQTAESQQNTSNLDNSSNTTSGNSLSKYTVNLTEKAQQGLIDPVLGRDSEVRQIIDILTRRRQNNPILTGEAGVGKTAVVEGFALRISNGDVPETLKNVHIHTLDLGLLQAGASIKGEFENRLKSVIEEVKASPIPIIMFIDEAHTLIGAGGKEGQGDAANLLKPALARGELRTIAATTWTEYKKYFERDPALTRRFQVVKVDEPDEKTAIEMMRGIAASLQEHHKVHILDEAIVESVRLSARYMPGRQLPDKSVSLLDTACARVSLSQSTTPANIEDLQRSINQSEINISRLEKELAFGGDLEDEIQQIESYKQTCLESKDTLNDQWNQEKDLIKSIKDIKEKLEKNYLIEKNNCSDELLTEDNVIQLKDELAKLTTKLTHTQKETPLMRPNVDAQSIAEVIANWTGIPVGKMLNAEIDAVIDLTQQLQQRVIGQSHAMDIISKSIQTSRAGLTDPRKPVGVFLMVGPSGVGKTETAMALADIMYGGEQNITVINMSEFKEEHKVSMLLGSPPGYIGYGEGGVLTEAARRKPYSIILLDEMEKAHPGVQDVFYQMFDKGTIKDGEGRDIDFKNTIIIMTSNAGEEVIRHICEKEEEPPEYEDLLEMFRPALLKSFRPAFLGRTQVIPYYPLDDEILMKISTLYINKIENRIANNYCATFSYDEDVPLHIVARSQEVDTGARNIENIINKTILPELAGKCLLKVAENSEINNIHIKVNDEGKFSYDIN